MEFAKIYERILRSSVWMEDDATLRVWITLLVLADKDGDVTTSIPGLAHTARVSVEACQRAIERFESPDPYSTTPDNEGRRVEAITGGFRVLNFPKYYATQTKTQCREAEKKRKQRKKQGMSPHVPACPPMSPRVPVNEDRDEDRNVNKNEDEETESNRVHKCSTVESEPPHLTHLWKRARALDGDREKYKEWWHEVMKRMIAADSLREFEIALDGAEQGGLTSPGAYLASVCKRHIQLPKEPK